MTQYDPSIDQHAEAYKAGLSDREAGTLPDGSRPVTAFQHLARWFGTAWIRPEAAAEVFDSNRDEERPSGSNSKTVVGSMMPSLADAKRKPRVVSQLPA
jgi:hypothetical protein